MPLISLKWLPALMVVGAVAEAEEQLVAALQAEDACMDSAGSCALNALQRAVGVNAAADGYKTTASTGDAIRGGGTGWTRTRYCANSLNGKCIEGNTLFATRLEQACANHGVKPFFGCLNKPCEYTGIRYGNCKSLNYSCVREWSSDAFDQLKKWTVGYGLTWYKRPRGNDSRNCA